MTHDDVARWLDRYVDAWKSYDAAEIGDLFAADAEYRYRPSLEPVRGREAIAADWIANRDVAGTYDAEYRPWAVEGHRAVATGTTWYADAEGRRAYSNVFLLEFDEHGRCASFAEVWVEAKDLVKDLAPA